jgi:hypothetical protein
MKSKGGQPGNTNASRKNRIVSNALSRVVTQNPEKIRQACERLLDRAAEGDLPAFREIMDRLEGKPIQAVEGAGEGGSITLTISTDDKSVL